MRRLNSLLLAGCLLAGCGTPDTTIEIRFAASAGGTIVDCESAVSSPHLSDLRFYVSELHLIDVDGSKVAINLVENGRWQGNGIALLDLEDGTGHCVNGTPDINDTVRGSIRQGDFRALQFVVGVPFELNHADPLLAAPPLDDSTMHWHWRSGYKFLRAGLSAPGDSFYVHLGSAGCTGRIGAISNCDRPNRISVRIPDWTDDQPVLIRLDALLEYVDLTDGEPSSCSSGPAEASCQALFDVFGLDSESGQPRAQQRLFQQAVQ